MQFHFCGNKSKNEQNGSRAHQTDFSKTNCLEVLQMVDETVSISATNSTPQWRQLWKNVYVIHEIFLIKSINI